MRATRNAIPAPSIVHGHVYSEAQVNVPLTNGRVKIVNLRTHHSVMTYTVAASWWATLPPDQYSLPGWRAANEICPALKFTVPSGLRIDGPTIWCQGV